MGGGDASPDLRTRRRRRRGEEKERREGQPSFRSLPSPPSLPLHPNPTQAQGTDLDDRICQGRSVKTEVYFGDGWIETGFVPSEDDGTCGGVDGGGLGGERVERGGGGTGRCEGRERRKERLDWSREEMKEGRE